MCYIDQLPPECFVEFVKLIPFSFENPDPSNAFRSKNEPRLMVSIDFCFLPRQCLDFDHLPILPRIVSSHHLDILSNISDCLSIDPLISDSIPVALFPLSVLIEMVVVVPKVHQYVWVVLGPVIFDQNPVAVVVVDSDIELIGCLLLEVRPAIFYDAVFLRCIAKTRDRISMYRTRLNG